MDVVKAHRAYYQAIYDAWVREAVLMAFIKLPLENEIRFLVGHDPQKLLTYQPTCVDVSQLWSKETLDALMGISYDDMVKMMFPASTLIEHETIDFEPTTRDYTVLLVATDGPVVAEQTKREEITRKLAPFISPTGRLVYETNIPPRQEGKTVQTRFHMSSDWSEIEMRVLLATLQHETADQVILDLSKHGGEIASAYSLMGQSAG